MRPEALSRLGPNRFVGALAAVALASIYIYVGFPEGFVNGRSAFWLAETQDTTQYAAGFMAFFREPWHWPLLRIESLNWPEGTLATFVDVVPLFAVILKLLVPSNLGPFNPYGYWIALCLVLQAVGGWWALREARVGRWSALLALVCLLLTTPILQHRLGHVSLFSQWILVFAIALTLRSERLGQTSAGWCPLLLCALFINVYLTAMTALLYAVDLWRHRSKPRLRVWLQWPALTAFLGASLLFVTMWPLPGHHLAQDEGFGIYSMNLLAPVTGSRFFWLTSPTINDAQAVEGFNYLGLGVLLLLICVWRYGSRPQVSCGSSPVLTHARTFWGLLLLLALYALSNRVSFGSVQIIEWALPESARFITGPFRASGRFFWPVVYVAMIFGVIAVSRYLRAGSLWLVMVCVCALQVADRWTAIQALHGKGIPSQFLKLDKTAWENALGDNIRTIYFYPKMRCGKNSSFYDTLLPVMRFAAERGLNLTSGYIARYAPDCDAMTSESRASNSLGAAYVFVNAEYSAEDIYAKLPEATHWQCVVVDFATVCKPLGAPTP